MTALISISVSSRMIAAVAVVGTLSGIVPLPRAQAADAHSSPAHVEFYERKIRPVLVNSCYSCHSADTKPAGGLRVDDLNGLLTGGNTGPAIVRGDPDKSLLIARVIHDDPKRRMPKEGDLLTKEQVEDLRTWIRDGAAWPAVSVPGYVNKTPEHYATLKSKHWAWQPVTDPRVPAVKNTAWPRSDVDRFILAKLEAERFHPVGDADPVTLIRRVTFDLTGLPPTPEAIDAFRRDPSQKAYEKVVDGLLASRAFAEHWARHWLDLARYAESTGPSRNIPYPHAWRYRDYVIDAVARDIPFDRFIHEQIAGDLLPASDNKERDRLLTATGFLALGVKDVNQRFRERFVMDNIDEQIDTVTRSVLGLTVSCARCHDHKFDPIATRDYYSLAGIFASSIDRAGLRNQMGGAGLAYYVPKNLLTLSSIEDLPKPPKEQVDKLTAEVAAAKKAWDEIRGTKEGLALDADGRPKQRPFRLKYEKLQAELNGLTDPAERGYAVHGASESTNIVDTAIRIRGQAEKLGPVVPRGFLTTYTVPNTPVIPPDQSGRLQLAQWLTNPANPLPPRVAVNRVWQHLFGTGLVPTPDNFGVKGEKPVNPELLDHLAGQFIRNGWSTKKLIRELVLTRAYRLGSEVIPQQQAKDPANKWVWRHAPRRLNAEEIRDTILASAGTLDSKPFSGSPASKLKMIEIRDNGPEASSIHEQADRALHRSIYLPVLRGLTPRTLAAFDPVDQNLVTVQRDATTVPTQSLFLLNSTFVRKQSLALALRLLHETGNTENDRIQRAYQLVLGRRPDSGEIKRARTFVADYARSYQGSAPTDLYASLGPVAPPASAGNAASVVPEDPDNIDRSTVSAVEEVVRAQTPEAAAWQGLVQSLYASAEFRFVR